MQTQDCQESVKVFGDLTATQDEIGTAGEHLFLKW